MERAENELRDLETRLNALKTQQSQDVANVDDDAEKVCYDSMSLIFSLLQTLPEAEQQTWTNSLHEQVFASECSFCKRDISVTQCKAPVPNNSKGAETEPSNGKDRSGDHPSSPLFCMYGCSATFCSAQCRKSANRQGHNTACPALKLKDVSKQKIHSQSIEF
eukprot:CAMPEP_0184706600 /NCGR_PEP_ID=MMETSP0313-20130426/36840_1 /TAXON_ID=2792 /ORGANISM="Porphyridium aerugineum, Strain SAG 1380-2" /LENGTH=162 /DNA_ID=CAMNT_0027168159 /DNA_START=33 /DNA_END=521 /DNA_ORIENTATION=+